ncbi:cell envelope-related transcriptional attenuator [Arthrobacter sp. Hiyo6]|nr:cell envelope-related transcriptional attenuator [Arthrobacter sp. Hiyo6]
MPGSAARHTDNTPLGAARHLGPLRSMPAWLKVITAAVAILLVGVLAFGAYWVIRLQGNLTTSSLGAGSSKSEGP